MSSLPLEQGCGKTKKTLSTYLSTWDKGAFESARRHLKKKYNRATGINQKSPRKAGISGHPVKDPLTFKIQPHPSVSLHSLKNLVTSLYVYGVFQ